MSNMMPLSFYIAPFRWYKSTSQSDAYKYTGLVIDALNAWQNAAGGCIGFNVVNALIDSHVNLEWKRVDRKSLGHCQFHYDPNGRYYSAEVKIGLSDGIICKNIWMKLRFIILSSMKSGMPWVLGTRLIKKILCTLRTNMVL